MTKKASFNYEEAVKIDPYNLDKEWVKQAEYTLTCMEALAEARKELDLQKELYDLTVADVDREIRESADKKPVEKAIEGLVALDTRVQQAKKDVMDAKYNVNMLEAARAGLENKREALTNLVKLHGMSYYAEPDADIQARGELEDMRQQAVREKVKIGSKKTTSTEPDQIRRSK